LLDLSDVGGDAARDSRIDSILLFAHEGFARELQEYAAIDGRHGWAIITARMMGSGFRVPGSGFQVQCSRTRTRTRTLNREPGTRNSTGIYSLAAVSPSL
jgi:hypothetical protein